MPPKGSTKAKAPAAASAAKSSPSVPKTTPVKAHLTKKVYSALEGVGDHVCPVGVEYEGDVRISAQNKAGIFTHALKLEAPASFSVVNTLILNEGPFAGHQAIVIRPAKSFPFLKLPDEARNRVYRFYLASNGIVNKSISLDAKRKESKLSFAKLYAEGQKNRVALLAVNQQIYAEAAPILYSLPLSFADTTTLVDFTLDLSPRNRERLQHIEVKGYVKNNARNAMNTLAEASNLKRLRITQGITCDSDPAKTARALYSDMYKLLESIGSKLGDKQAAVDILTFGKQAFKYKDSEKQDSFYSAEMILEVKSALKAKISAA